VAQRKQTRERVTEQGARNGPRRAWTSAGKGQRATQPPSSVVSAAGVIVCHRCAFESAASVRLGFLKFGHQ